MTTEALYNYFTSCTSICTDTRKIEPGCLFVALKGDNFNANNFASEALQKGAMYAVIDEASYKTSENMLLVDDSLVALQKLATYHRNKLGLPIIALTGSNGKTTTKELINVVLSKKYNVGATLGNLNNHIGVPLTLLSFTDATEIGIVEMGANHKKEIEMLCEISRPNFGYITNFGKAHLEGFGGVEGVIEGKSELYYYLKEHTKTAFVNIDDPIQNEKTASLSRFTFASEDYNCDVRISSVKADPMVTVEYNDVTISSNLIGKYNAANISAAIAIGHYFKISDADIKNAIEGYIPANNRSQLLERNGVSIILDAYNANPSSMVAAMENFLQLENVNKVAILGDMFELGIDSPEEHKALVSLLSQQNGTQILFTGPYFYSHKIHQANLRFFEDFNMLKEYISQQNYKGHTLLIKGSRGMALERILENL